MREDIERLEVRAGKLAIELCHPGLTVLLRDLMTELWRAEDRILEASDRISELEQALGNNPTNDKGEG